MYWELLSFYESNNIEYYIAFPTQDSGEVLKQKCHDRVNSDIFIEKVINNLVEYKKKLIDYKPKEVLYINKNENLEDALINKNLLKL